MGLEMGQTLRQRALWRPLEWRTNTLPFIDIPFQLFVVLSFISLSLFCPRLETHAYKYMHWAPRKGSDVDQDVRAVSSFSPLLSVLRQLQRAP